MAEGELLYLSKPVYTVKNVKIIPISKVTVKIKI